MIADVLSVAAGVALILLTMNDVFQSVIVPRAVGRQWRISFYAWRWAWIVWPPLAWKISGNDDERREDLLAYFAPGMLVGLIAIWGTLLVLGFGAIMWGLRGGLAPQIHSFWSAAYFRGDRAYDDRFRRHRGPHGGHALLLDRRRRDGLGFLRRPHRLFVCRDRFVPSARNVRRDARRANGHAAVRRRPARDRRLFADDRRSRAHLLRSAAMDGAVDGEPARVSGAFLFPLESRLPIVGRNAWNPARRRYAADYDGRRREPGPSPHLLQHRTPRDSRSLALPARITPESTSSGSIAAEFDAACERLSHAGIPLREREAAWERFSTMRAGYAPHLNALARFFEIPPLQWVGDRGPIDRPSLTRSCRRRRTRSRDVRDFASVRNRYCLARRSRASSPSAPRPEPLGSACARVCSYELIRLLKSMLGVRFVEEFFASSIGTPKPMLGSDSKRESASPKISPVSAKKSGAPLSPGTIDVVTSTASLRIEERSPALSEVASPSPSSSNSSGTG